MIIMVLIVNKVPLQKRKKERKEGRRGRERKKERRKDEIPPPKLHRFSPPAVQLMHNTCVRQRALQVQLGSQVLEWSGGAVAAPPVCGESTHCCLLLDNEVRASPR